MAQDCTSETRHRTIDTIDEFRVQHPKLSLAIEILTIDGVGNVRRQEPEGYSARGRDSPSGFTGQSYPTLTPRNFEGKR